MTTGWDQYKLDSPRLARGRAARLRGIVLLAAVILPASTMAQPNRFCSQTAVTLFSACNASVDGDVLVKKAICLNVSNDQARGACLAEMRDMRDEGKQDCRDQKEWRLAACETLGQGRYDPDVSPALFDDPTKPTHPNPFYPLRIGNRWEYRGGGERNTVEIVDETKLIDGVRCLVARDLVFAGGDLTEATDDWFAQAKDATTWYFGEESKSYESFDGDDPRRPELVSVDGSFKAGRDGAKPGIIFLASPTVGDVYTEESSLANAEDATVILSTTYRYGQDSELDHLVPQQLADRFCSGDCVVTKNFSLLEPDVIERKYYARGIGVFLEVELEEQSISQLVDCNFDERCDDLPQP